jgi:uncharacterized protein (TIGR02270 family)
MQASRAHIANVLQQHVEDVVVLRSTRAVLVRAPHVKLHLLQRLDERLAAHVDGVMVAGDAGREACVAALDRPTSGTVFAATLMALERRDSELLRRMLAVAEAEGPTRAGLVGAFGWVSASSLRGITKELLDSPQAFLRDIGLAACAMHEVPPGTALDVALVGDMPSVVAMRVAVSLGQVRQLPACLRGLADKDPVSRSAAARAALLLGDRDTALRARTELLQAPGSARDIVLRLAVKVLVTEQVHALLKQMSQDPALLRSLIRGTGAAGDPHYVPWLIKQMADLKLTRLAGEAFSMITGLDLAYLDLDMKPPEGAVFGPNDDPADADVAMDEDDSLPWPDVDKISAWWQANGSRFQSGTRYFVGEPPSAAHCISVLKSGFQRQRIAAAEYLCLLQPGTPLFNVAAPAWRQQRLLAQLGA